MKLTHCDELNILYFNLPDYLGSVEFITDMRGDPYQFFLNTPFGENLENQMAYQYKGFSSRFRFNGKEWDDRAFKKCPVDIFSEGASLPRGQGNYYYGARYYDPKVSVWLSVDPLAHEFPSWTPYHFVHNNPLNLVDFDGRNAWKPGEEDGVWVAEPGDGAETLARDAGISREEAYRIMEEQGHGTYTENGVTKSDVDIGNVVKVGGANTSSTSCSSSCTQGSSGNPQTQGANGSKADKLAHVATVSGLTNMGKEGLIKALTQSGGLSQTALKYLAGGGMVASAAGVWTSYLQAADAAEAGDDLARRKAELRMGTNAMSWWFPIGTGAWAGAEISLFLNPTMKDPQDAGWTDTRVGCFIKGTMISTVNGSVPIEKIAVGDSIQSADGLSLEVGVSLVKQVMKTKETKAVYIIKLESGDSLLLSESHPVYTRINGWRAINTSVGMDGHDDMNLSVLEVGDEVIVLSDFGKLVPVKIESIRTSGEFVYMYNLVKVENHNTFFANKVLVHNKFIAK